MPSFSLLALIPSRAVYRRVELDPHRNALEPWREAVERFALPEDHDSVWTELAYPAQMLARHIRRTTSHSSTRSWRATPPASTHSIAAWSADNSNSPRSNRWSRSPPTRNSSTGWAMSPGCTCFASACGLPREIWSRRPRNFSPGEDRLDDLHRRRADDPLPGRFVAPRRGRAGFWAFGRQAANAGDRAGTDSGNPGHRGSRPRTDWPSRFASIFARWSWPAWTARSRAPSWATSSTGCWRSITFLRPAAWPKGAIPSMRRSCGAGSRNGGGRSSCCSPVIPGRWTRRPPRG